MSSKPSMRSGRTAKRMPPRRNPRTLKVDDNKSQLPALIPESFSLKNFDLVGKVDDMRALTKELSVMARQIEQWVGVIYTISMAFRDNGVLKDLVSAISNIGNNQYKVDEQAARPPQRQAANQPQSPFPFPFFGGPPINEDSKNQNMGRNGNENSANKGGGPFDGINIFEILNNPAFREIVSKLFLQKK